MSYSGGVCDKASKKWIMLLITKIKSLRLSKAILNLSVQDVGVGILKSVLDQQAVLTHERWACCGVQWMKRTKRAVCVNWEDVGCWHSAWDLLPGLHVVSSLSTAAKLLIVLIPSLMKWQTRSRLCIMLSLKKKCYAAVVSLVGWDFRSNQKWLKISRKSIIELWAIENIALVTLTNLFSKIFNVQKWERSKADCQLQLMQRWGKRRKQLCPHLDSNLTLKKWLLQIRKL